MRRDPDAAYRAMLSALRSEFPRFRLVRKQDSALQKGIHVALAVITLGRQRRYLDDYVTTLGQRVYVPPGWDERPPLERICTLRHERVHLRQFRRFGLVPMALLYLLVPLPLGLAWCRMRFERAAYEESARAAWELLGPTHVLRPEYRRRLVEAFTGGAYGWMWPFPRRVGRWFDGLVAELLASGRSQGR